MSPAKNIYIEILLLINISKKEKVYSNRVPPFLLVNSFCFMVPECLGI